jgi:uncharacterized membrane protein
MDRPMRTIGPTAQEIVLGGVLAAGGGLLGAWALAAWIADGTLLPGSGVGGGVLVGLTACAGLGLLMGSAGVRQNAVLMGPAYTLLAVTALAWTIASIVQGEIVALLAGVLMLGLVALVFALRRRALRARFKPLFLSPSQFLTMIQVADTMIDGDGREAIGPVVIAKRVDRLLHEVRTPVRDEIRMVLIVVEYVLPLLVLRPLPFSALGSHLRRQAVTRVIGARLGLFRDVARSLKVLASVGYYGDPAVQLAMGYVPYDDRERSEGRSQAPLVHPDPFREPIEPVEAGPR